jgi:hypothetical protein
VLQRLEDTKDTYEIGFEFNELDWTGHTGIFFGEPVNVQQVAGLSSSISHNSMRTRDTMAALITKSTREDVWPPEMPGVATFFLTAARVIPKGLRMTWRTKETTTLSDLKGHRRSGN